MNEIEKMYSNAGVKPLCQIPDKYCGVQNVYEDFTAEKQLELIKWLLDSICLLNLKRLQFSENFENDLAGLINELWQDMTDEEKQQVKGILE